MTSQRFCLRWNNHQSNMLTVFDQLLHAETFTDVTLAVEGQYLKAHKMVLSACSPYFNALFVNHPEKHPIVILKDVPYADMKSLLDFMYRGEVSVDQERLTAFLRVAESLRIKGLTEVNDDKPMGPAITPPPPPQLHRIQPYLVQQRKTQNMLMNSSPLLGSALSSMPKRKRGRPRKLSGSSNGTGNDCDDYDRDNLIQGSPELLEVKMGTDGYSANEGSDDNQRDSGDNDHEQDSNMDAMDTSESLRKSHIKDSSVKENDHSASDKLNNSPELTQRLLGIKIESVSSQQKSIPKIRINSSIQASALTNAGSQNALSSYPNSLLQQQLQSDSLNNNNNSNNNSSNNNNNNNNNTSNRTSDNANTDNANTNVSSSKKTTDQSSMSSSNVHQQYLMQIKSKTPSSTPEYYKEDNFLQISTGKSYNESESDTGLSKKEPLSPTGNSNQTNPNTPRQVQRRRVRRKANSSLDEQAEHLTEMSVRGLDLFRYASIDQGVYHCTECAKENVQKTFKNKYSFQRHAFLYHEGKHRKVFPCPVCAKEFSRPDKMKNHMKTTHECYLPKEVNYHHPLNYLITAAATGDIQQIIPASASGVNDNVSHLVIATMANNEKTQDATAVAETILDEENLNKPPNSMESSIQIIETEEVK